MFPLIHYKNMHFRKEFRKKPSFRSLLIVSQMLQLTNFEQVYLSTFQ